MITKNISKYLALFFVGFGLAVTTACSNDDDPFFTASEDDAPRILNTDIPEGKGGEPGVLKNIDRTQNFTYEAIVTPVNYTTVSWLILLRGLMPGMMGMWMPAARARSTKRK